MVAAEAVMFELATLEITGGVVSEPPGITAVTSFEKSLCSPALP
jgi:hypothetical protein